MSLWLDNSSNSNNLKHSYVHGFLDISGGNINLRANNNLNIFSETDTSNSRFTLSSDEIRVYDDNTSSFVDLSNNKLQFIKDVNENVQTRLTDLTSRTQKIRTTTGGDIEVSANIIPNVASAIDLGSETKPFNSLYLNDSTLYFVGSGDNSNTSTLSVDANGEVFINKGHNGERKLINQSKSDNNKTKIGHNIIGALSNDGVTLDTSGHAVFRNDVRISGHLNVDGSINFLGDFIQKDTLITVTEQMDLSNDGTGPALIVRQYGAEAIASFYDDGDVAMIINDGGDVSMNMNLNVGGNAEINGSTTMSGTTTMSSDANISGDVSMNSKLSVGDDVSLNNDVDIAGDLNVSGNITGNFADNSIPSSAISGSASSINVSVINTDGDISNQLTASTLRFDTDSGFALDDLSNGVVKVKMNSTFKYWNVDGQDSLVAEGLDTMNFFTDGNIQIITDGSDANHITFKAPNMVDSSANQDISGIKTFQQIFVYDDVCLNSNLNVIGDADISGTLDVAGDITGVTDLNVTGYSYLDDVETTGNVGIKTSEAAAYELEVNGTAYATDISAGSSIKVGSTTISSTETNLSGTPTAPTASSETNNTQIATTAFVQTLVSSNSSSSSGSSYVTEQPPVLASISKDAQSSYVDVTWVKFDEVYKDAFTGRSYPIYLQTFVDISFTSINSQSSNGWKTIRIGNGNYNTSGSGTTPLTTLRFTAASGLNYNNSTGYSISFTGKPGTDNLPVFTQDDTFDLRVYAVNNSGTVPAYIYIYNVGLKTTGAPSAVLIKNTDTYAKTSFKMDVSFNLDSEDTSITSGIDITEYDISYTLIDTKSNEAMTHSGVFDLNNYNNKNNLTFTGLKPGSKYRVQIRAKNALNSEIGPYGDAFTGSNFTNDGTNRYINTSDLNAVSHNGMTISRGNAETINGKIVGNNTRGNRFVFSANYNNSKITFANTSSFYVNYGRQGKDFTNGTYVTATFEILKNGSVQYSDTMDFTNSASALTASIGAANNQFTFTSASSYTDKGKTTNYSKGFVYSSSLSCTGNENTNSIFNANFPASTDKYKVQYTISSQSHNNNQRIDENGNASTSINSADFYVDNYSGTPSISYTTTPTVSIPGKTYLFGVPSITNIQLTATYSISNFASYYIPYGTISSSNNIHSKSEVTSSKNGYSFGTVTRDDISTTNAYSTTFTKNNNSITNGTYNANTTQSLLVTVHYLNNSGIPTVATQTSTTNSNNLGPTFKDTTTSYSGNNLRFFNGSDTISGSNIDTDNTTFATTYSSNISSALLYFNGRFVAGGYSKSYNSTSLSPFSDWSGFAVSGPNYSSYSNTGSGGFKWIAIQVSRSGNSVDLSNFKIGTGTGSATRHDNHLSNFGSKYKAYIYQDGKFGSLSSASNSGATSWFGTGPTTISAADSANGALQANGYDAFVNSNGGTTLYLIVGIDQDSEHYFTF